MCDKEDINWRQSNLSLCQDEFLKDKVGKPYR